MPSLIFEHSGTRRGGVIDGRVLIGRTLSRGVVINDARVSRLHAWIDNREGAFVLTDCGSRTGTFVNGESIVRYELQDGDEIRIGPTNLVFKEEAGLPADVEKLNLSSNGAVLTLGSVKSGILFDCKCGAPLWVGNEYAGKRGLCKYCSQPIRVPGGTKVKATKPQTKRARPGIDAPLLVPPKPLVKCGVCHCEVEEGEDTTVCLACRTSFHTDCWHENYGCSTYGCSQVNALKPAELVAEEAKAGPPAEEEEPVLTPWDPVLLAASIVGSIVGALLFGIPAMTVGIASVARLVSGECRKRGLVVLAIGLSIAGALLGLALSDFWWFNGQHLAVLLRSLGVEG